VAFIGLRFVDFNNYKFLFFLNISWLLIGYFTKIYHYKRTIKITTVVSQLVKQYFIYIFVLLSYFSLTDTLLNTRELLKVLGVIFIAITFFRAFYFRALRRYRIEGGNFRNVILIGGNKNLSPVLNFMMNRNDFGYKVMGFFSDDKNPILTYKQTNKALIHNGNGKIDFLGKVDQCYNYAIDNTIDEIYCSNSDISQETINKIIDFGDSNFIEVKLIPDSNDIFSKNMFLEYYGYVPVLSIRKLPFDDPVAKFFKRFFDIVFSLLVIVFVLSWLTPILYVLIKRESEGPLYFKQVRDGLRGGSFVCYKYRSMGINNRSDEDQTVKNDIRITKIGKFIRKTSLDELPQFINVLKGEMSVVGPRPHMQSQSKIFKKIVDKYMVRHFVKPGITGLAQVRGFRGEIETDNDIINRVKLDIFYIENWSFIMDINIIIKTVTNIFKGEEKAY
jgi:putative colanic acid biosynthesis UDP-glucose lipid carrier transferase